MGWACASVTPNERHSFLQLKVLPRQAAKRSVASKSHLCLAPLVVEVLNGIEIGVDTKQRNLCNLTLTFTRGFAGAAKPRRQGRRVRRVVRRRRAVVEAAYRTWRDLTASGIGYRGSFG